MIMKIEVGLNQTELEGGLRVEQREMGFLSAQGTYIILQKKRQ